jgi:hypothetical protein
VLAHLALLTSPLQAVQVGSQSVGNEGHFALEAETVFRPYVERLCSGVTDTTHPALSARALDAEQDWSKWVRKGGHFTLEDKRVLPSYPPSHSPSLSSGVNETSHFALRTLAL